MKFRQGVLLENYTTFKIGGPAKYFCIVKNKEDLIEAVAFAKKEGLPFFILGGGSNLLVSDKGFKGVVIKIQNTKYKIQNTKVLAGAGVSLARLLSVTVNAGLSGLEWSAGIPGATVGGAVRGNAGAFGIEMKNLVRKVEALDTRDQKIKIFNNKDCQFGYRESIFSALGGKNINLIILSCELQLEKVNKEIVQEKIKEILNYRKEKHSSEPSAGSIFKNSENIRARDLIERAGLKGKKIGGAKISEKHANFIINTGRATAKDVLKLINLTKKEVKNQFGIKLEEEIEFLGF